MAAAITDPAVSVALYKQAIHVSNDDSDETIRRQLDFATEWLWDKCGQFFTKDASAVERIFRAKYSDRLDLDYEGNCPGIATTSGLIIKVDTDNDGSFADETAWASTDYELHPLQADKGPNPEPWNVIKTTPWGTKTFRPGGLVSVTAVFGHPSVPAIVKEVVIEWTAVWRMESPRATAQVNELDQIESVSPYHLGMLKRAIEACRTKKVTF